MAMYFSAQNLAFYDDELREGYYEQFDAWPDDAVLMNDKEAAEYCGVTSPTGKTLSSKKGRPIWVNLPPKSKEQLISEAESKKQSLLVEANNLISPLQDAVDLDMATEEEIALLKEWKKYRVLLNRIDTSLAPDIEWPQKPH